MHVVFKVDNIEFNGQLTHEVSFQYWYELQMHASAPGSEYEPKGHEIHFANEVLYEDKG